jgi:hypothetical protein
LGLKWLLEQTDEKWSSNCALTCLTLALLHLVLHAQARRLNSFWPPSYPSIELINPK